MVKVLVWNARGLSNKKYELDIHISTYDIVIITESKINALDKVRFSGYNVAGKKSVGSSGGIIIAIRKDFEFTEIKDWRINSDNFDVCGIRLNNTNVKFNLIAVYRRPYDREKPEVWSNLLKFDSKGYGSIITGDFNAHNMAWNCNDTDYNGENLHEKMYNQGYLCVNVDTLSRLNYSNQSASNIDLVFADSGLVDLIDYEQLEDAWGSDHFPISFEIKTNVIIYRKCTNRLSTKGTDWPSYCNYMKEEMKQLEKQCEGSDLQEKYSFFTDTMKAAVNVASGRDRKYKKNTEPNLQKEMGKKQQVKWFDKECMEAIENRKKKLKIYRNTQTRHSFIEYKKYVAIARKTCKRKKRESFQNFCNSITRFTSLNYVWNTMKIFKKGRNKVSWNKWQVTDRSLVIKEEIDKLSAPGVSVESQWIDPKNEEEALDSLFSKEELYRALGMIKKDSAPGRDNIDYMMIKNLPPSAQSFLLSILNEVWRGKGIPREWREYQVIFIDKVNKEKVRPISLSSCMGKVMERLINERLVWWAEKNRKMHPTQNGFRRGRSCIENLTKIVTDIKVALHSDEYAMAAFLDVTSAYDNVQFHILKAKLRKMKCPKRISAFINTWLNDRDVEYIINNKEKVKRVSRRGLPQGAVLSPILYALYTNDITTDVSDDVYILQFADDIAIYTTGVNREENKQRIEEAVNIVASNLELIGLDLEPRKTALVEFSKSGYIDRNMHIQVKGVQVPNIGETKFLGVRLDNRLTFKNQVSEVRAKIERANSILKYLNNVTRGSDGSTALMLYKSLVRSVADYGCFVYAPGTDHLILKLERGQFLGLRTALGYRNSTPTNVIVAEAKVDLLRDRALMLAKNFCCKILKYGNPEIRQSLENLCNKEQFIRLRHPLKKKSVISLAWERVSTIKKNLGHPKENYEVWEMEYADLTRDIAVDIEIGKNGQHRKKTKKSISLNNIKYNAEDLELIASFSREYELDRPRVIYTDGSKSEDTRSTGAGIVLEECDEAFYMSLPASSSSFTAEAFGVKVALEKLEQEQTQSKVLRNNVLILSDCQSLLKAIKNNRLDVYKNQYVLDIRRRHFRLKDRYGLRIVYGWIPAHRGYTGNEVADALAKMGAREEADETIEVPISDYRCLFKQEAWLQTQDTLVKESRYKGKDYFNNFYDKDRKKPWFQKVRAERYFYSFMNRIRANHYNLNESLARKEYIDSARCECGYEREDIYHVVWQCRRYEGEREKMDEELVKRGIVGTEPIELIIKREDWTKIQVIYNFVKKINRII